MHARFCDAVERAIASGDDTYGRFPGGTDAMHLMWVMQAQHIDTDYYDQLFGPGAYGPTHAAHLAKWHR